jgi:gluconate 2-dehydrogenase alpha chain
MRSAIIERFGKQGHSEHTSIVDWPITYDDLEPYYDRAEWSSVSGRPATSTQIVAGGIPSRRRAARFPMPPLKAGAADDFFVKAAEPRIPPVPAAGGDRVHRRLAEVRSAARTAASATASRATSTRRRRHTTRRFPPVWRPATRDPPHSRVIRVLRSDARREVRGVEYLDSRGRCTRSRRDW